MDPRVQILIAVMKDDLHRKLSVSELARFVNLSRSRLRHLFKTETGMSPAHYLRSLRVERAKELLETTPLSVEQIMLRVGVRDRSHFDREFKKHCGLTPTQYRMATRLVTSVKKL